MESGRRPACPLVAVVECVLLLALLAGCGPDRRAAVRTAIAQVETASARAGELIALPNNDEAMRVALAGWTRDLAAIDVSTCPDEYRTQHARLLASVQRAHDMAQLQPEGFLGSTLDAIGGNKAKLAMLERLQEVDRELGALLTVAEKYRR